MILKSGAHNNLDADAIPLKAARNGHTKDFATEFNRWKVDEGVDAESWALNDGVDLGAGLETCECQEARHWVGKWKPGLGLQPTTWPRRTVFERDNPHGLDADRDKLNLHLDATSD